MGVRATSVQSSTLLNATVAINAETIIVTSPPVSEPLDNAVVFLFWYMVHTVGTTGTVVRYLLRRGTTLATAIVNVVTSLTGVPGNTVTASGVYFDSPGIVAGVQYSLTCQDIGSTATGAVQDGALLVMVL